MTECAIECELGAVAIGDGGVVVAISLIQCGDCSDGFLRSEDERHLFADAFRLAEPFQISVGAFDRAFEPLPRLPSFDFALAAHAQGPVRLPPRRDPVCEGVLKERYDVQHRVRERCAVAEPEILEFPDELNVDAVSCAEAPDLIVDAAPECRSKVLASPIPRRERSGLEPRAASSPAAAERASLEPAPMRGQFGSMHQADRNQTVDRRIGINQFDLQVARLPQVQRRSSGQDAASDSIQRLAVCQCSTAISTCCLRLARSALARLISTVGTSPGASCSAR